MNRVDLQRLARLRLAEAEALLASGYFSGAYYLAGYCVELAFKACIAKQTRQYDFPDKDRVNASYVHSLERLSIVAKLDVPIRMACKEDARFDACWTLAKNWSEQSRYEEYSESEAKNLVDSIRDPNDGVLQWIKRFW